MKTNWQTKKLGEVCDIYQPKTISAKEMSLNGKYVVFGANGIIGRYDKYNHEEPQLLITCRGATCGTVNISTPKSWITGNAMVVRPKDNSLNLKYLEYIFRGGLNMTKIITGAAQPQITRTNLEPTEISYPESLDEQHRIVALLDEVFLGTSTAKGNAEKNLKNSRAVFESYLQDIFSGKNDEWEEKKLGDKNLFQIIDGDRGKNYPNKSDFSSEGYCLFLNTKNVRPDGFDFQTTMFVTEKKDKALGNGKLQRNDVLLTTRGTIGNIAVYDETVPFENIRINSGMLIFRPNIKVILPEYLFSIFQSGIMKTQIKKYVSGAAQPQLPIKTLINFSIPVPKSLSEQKAIVARLDALSGETKKLEEIYRQKIADVEELKKSVLKKAFSGEL